MLAPCPLKCALVRASLCLCARAPPALPNPLPSPPPPQCLIPPLPLPQETIATAVEVFHRFFAERSLGEYQASQRLDVVLMTCLFLAAKVEEQPRRIRDAINCVYSAREQLEALRTAAAASVADEDEEDDEQEGGGKEGGRNGRDARQQDDKRRRAPSPPPPPEAEDAILPLDRGYWEMKESVVDTEQLVLRVLGFDLNTYQPYRLLLNYARSLRARPLMVEVAWALLNDSLFSPVCCLKRPPQAQAVAALHLAQRMLVVQEQEQVKQEQLKDTKTMQISVSSNTSSSKVKKHTFVISSSKNSGRNTSSELAVDREMWAVLGAKAEDVKACCQELLTLYENGIGISPPAWAGEKSGEKGGGGVGRREGGKGVVVGMEIT